MSSVIVRLKYKKVKKVIYTSNLDAEFSISFDGDTIEKLDLYNNNTNFKIRWDLRGLLYVEVINPDKSELVYLRGTDDKSAHFPDFPHIAPAEKTLFKLKYGINLNDIEFDSTGNLTQESTIALINTAKSYVREGPITPTYNASVPTDVRPVINEWLGSDIESRGLDE